MAHHFVKRKAKDSAELVLRRRWVVPIACLAEFPSSAWEVATEAGSYSVLFLQFVPATPCINNSEMIKFVVVEES